MNLLIYDPPTQLEVDGVFYAIDSDYRTCLQIMQFFEDEYLTDHEKIQLMVEWLYDVDFDADEFPFSDCLAEAAQAAVDFLNCGDTLKTADTGRVYSLDKDSKWIRSAFEKSYNIRLMQTSLHWWEFCYKFLDLDEDSFFMRLMAMRARLNKGGKYATKEDKQFKHHNPELFNLEGKEFDAKSAFSLRDELLENQRRRRDGGSSW